MDFSFVHAADLHLDSPLIGLSQKSALHAKRVEDASRQAFDNLVNLAVEEDSRFVLIAGDLFDGDWRDYQTGLFFASRMRTLREAGIRVFVILGNHDAENRFVSRLELSENVKIFSSQQPESEVIEELGVAVHGQSFPQRDVSENLARGYPSPRSGYLNIGMLHTACTGRDGHAPYAPCSVDQLRNHGYDYWALGHVHAREVLSDSPLILYPGNLQGRHNKEAGDKGATIVRVENGRIVEATHRTLDVVRWANPEIDISLCADMDEILEAVRVKLQAACSDADNRALALRVQLTGRTELHHRLKLTERDLAEQIEMVAVNVRDDVWIEKMELRTKVPEALVTTDPSIVGRMEEVIAEIAREQATEETLERALSALRPKLPAGVHIDELFNDIRSQTPQRAIDLALSIIHRGHE